MRTSAFRSIYFHQPLHGAVVNVTEINLVKGFGNLENAMTVFPEGTQKPKTSTLKLHHFTHKSYKLEKQHDLLLESS